MKVHSYFSNSGRDMVKAYIDALPEEERVDGYSVLECMEKGEFEKIKFKRWAKKVYEVYFYKHNRIFYIVADGENIYLLHACKKQKNKTEKQDKRIVVERAKELEKIIGKKFI
ncbi:MAG: type II toxin-antitoxin system RelE/ParE family toxin [Agathobacter sp.]|nr:type II toxin-antitoxin system RelE/ParE family toxin [Agathobacter sp.]